MVSSETSNAVFVGGCLNTFRCLFPERVGISPSLFLKNIFLEKSVYCTDSLFLVNLLLIWIHFRSALLTIQGVILIFNIWIGFLGSLISWLLRQWGKWELSSQCYFLEHFDFLLSQSQQVWPMASATKNWNPKYVEVPRPILTLA